MKDKNGMSRKLRLSEQSNFEARSATSESTKRSTHSRKYSEKKYWNTVMSRKPNTFQQSPLEARFSSFESISKAPDYSVGYFKLSGNFLNLTFLKVSEKIIKNVISRNIERFEQSYFDARFGISEKTLTAPNFRVENFKFCQVFI